MFTLNSLGHHRSSVPPQCSAGAMPWAERPNGAAKAYTAITMSADGQKLVLLNKNGGSPDATGAAWYSSNMGSSWTVSTGSPGVNWVTAASGDTGQFVVAGITGIGVFTSTNAGAYFAQKASAAAVVSVDCDATGQTLAYAVDNGLLYVSTDSGSNWAAQSGTPGAAYWRGLALSANGSRLVAVEGNNSVSPGGYIWQRAGGIWTRASDAGPGFWRAVASSADGLGLVVVATDGVIKTSSDGGSTWQGRALGAPQTLQAVTSSADGQHLSVAAKGGYIWTSADAGEHARPICKAPTRLACEGGTVVNGAAR